MTFTPEKPERITDLWAQVDPASDEVVTIYYNSDEGLFYREDGNWVEMTGPSPEEDEDDIIYFVKPEFVAAYDESEKAGEAINTENLKQYVNEYKAG